MQPATMKSQLQLTAGKYERGISRSVEPEILDGLTEGSPDARAARRDLRIINLLTGSQTWIIARMRERRRAGEGVLELGAGAGELGAALGEIATNLAGLDTIGRPSGWPQSAAWIQADVLSFDNWACHPVVLGNLFFHHFKTDQLGMIGAHLNRHARLVIANEPYRGRLAQQLLSLLCPLIRAHFVTRHDGRVSIAAGFRQDELPLLLQLDPSSWRWSVNKTPLGMIRMVAERR